MLRLGKHPDRGGEVEEAQAINEAYETLSDPARRRSYDQCYLRTSERQREAQAPSNPTSPPRGEALLQQIRSRLSFRYHEVRDLPLAAAFDLLLEGPPPFKNRLMFIVYDHFGPENWSRVFGLFRLVDLHRSPWLPRADAVVVLADEAEDSLGFLKESLRRSALSAWTWGPRSLALLEKSHLHTEFFLYLVPPLADLQSALTVSA